MKRMDLVAKVLHDIKYGVRLLARAPGFAAAAILTVALGIGATTAMFSVVYGVVLKPLPYKDPDRLVNLWSTAHKRGLPRAYVGMANVHDWRARNHVFEEIAALRAVANFNLTGVGEPERLNASRVEARLFHVLGVTPLIGRTFTEDEDEIGHERVAILTYSSNVPNVGNEPNVDWRTVTPDYFRTMQIPLLSGRGFTEADDERAPLVMILDERVAARVFGNASPIGRRVRIAVANQPWHTVVGVVGHIRHDRLDDDVRPQVYWNYKQRTQDRMALVVRMQAPAAMPSGFLRGTSVSSRRGWGPGASAEKIAPAFAASLAAAIRSVDPEQPVYDARTLEAVVDRSLGSRWLQTVLLGAFASIALLLASIGVYGVIACAVGQRSREFGIRLALGATRREIVALVMRRGTALFAAGAGIGLFAAAATARVLATLLFNVTSSDLISFSSATIVLFLVALAACGIPARRAARVDPSIALRAE
ncbi:MAG TPA: ABC transporter permease [Vicinamibacterales bacterium]|jgi:hypothetical protein|nr:ABC transporter permease [Vicinamibacterales bacterium]